jgi:hypothetical protein
MRKFYIPISGYFAVNERKKNELVARGHKTSVDSFCYPRYSSLEANQWREKFYATEIKEIIVVAEFTNT